MAVVIFALVLKRLHKASIRSIQFCVEPDYFSGVEYFLTLLALTYFLFCDALPNGQSLGKCQLKMSVVGLFLIRSVPFFSQA
ncbi:MULTISPECIES: hypothetical protein [unclassified Pseudomonas]|uniref:hypothetical protein n=1 Tax=unclassified Pseudomonas TaxID=196821 RepID=UPI002AC9D902|nr:MULTISPECIES: hypothetical protein [unclassified Pseudomonas]MEB0043641.1 hypothetical protein [Pseudomonas sp. MH10]MEB0076821.1 hypothetical protein [Pseudomonas sp. MH10out]MEB0094379.1 hypothetical protein [Pseudomonas sp. CCI4.2]MEB0103484.1 hypothetical protein [Pseudomonas sp. CCI3.2]MEB0119198.1 hypothetical protein [Pseudomonas sp. CCI1.2]